MFFWNRKKAPAKEPQLPASEKGNTDYLETKGIEFGRTLLNHPMLQAISSQLSGKFIETIAKDIEIANQNTCKSFFHFYVERTGITWPKSVLKSANATVCSYSDYNISVVEEEYKLHGMAWALNSLIVPKVRAEYPQIVNWRAEKSSDNGQRLKVTLFFELKLNKFQSL